VRAFTAKQTAVQWSAGEKHFFDCRIHSRLRQDIVARRLDLKLGTSTHDFGFRRQTGVSVSGLGNAPYTRQG